MTCPATAPQFQRVGLLVGPSSLERFAACRVLIVGLGGVGSWCAEALVRTGFKRLTLVDSDTVCVTNVNRQVQATPATVGAVKVDALRERLLSINPDAEIVAQRLAYGPETHSAIALTDFDYVVDAIDSLENKVLLIQECVRQGVKCFASMGAAARLDPSLIRTGTLAQTDTCPLARLVRKELRKRGVPLDRVPCVYSIESPLPPMGEAACGKGVCDCGGDGGADALFPDWCQRKARINGAVVHMTAIFGFTLAGLIVRDAVPSPDLKPPSVLAESVITRDF